MNDGQNRQTFSVYDPRTLDKIGEKMRTDVHSEGDWHLAVTAFIFRGSSIDDIEVLVQERSQYVDIAQKHFDQSLATQLIVEDNEDTNQALYRGLREELDISEDELLKVFKWNNLGDILISKRYDDNPELWNREIVTNYLVRVKSSIVMKKNFKVQGYEWLPWLEFCDLVKMQPNNFTKSVRLYTVIDSISREIDECMKAMVSGGDVNQLQRKIYYLSMDNSDLVLFEGSKLRVEAYKTAYTMRRTEVQNVINGEYIKSAIFSSDRNFVNLLP